ncbi:MAG: beta-propeller fold lactonase family protein [Candidatus Velthaea sp.]
MNFRPALLALALAVVPASAAAASPAPVQFSAPAGALPAQHLRGATYDAVLPSGRIVTPLGESAVTGMNALGFALSPDGRFAIVSNDDERQGRTRSAVDPQVMGGYSLAVIDTASMRLVDHFHEPGATYFAGIAAIRDPQNAARTLVLAAGGPSNAVYAFTLDANGKLAPDARHLISMPGPIDPAFGDDGHSFPGTIVPSADGRRAYVVNEGAGSLAAIDTAARILSGPAQRVGFFPYGAAVAGNRVLISNEGLMRYATVAGAPLAPPFRTAPADPQRASSLSFVGLGPGGDLSSAPADAPPFAPSALPMDAAPDGTHIVGGAHPTAIAVTPDAAYAFVAMTNVDRIATVQLSATPRVVGGTELRLFDRGPYGTQPAALALSHDGSRLYVALAGLDAVAVIDARDPVHLHRLGLIPTGWYPSALALSADDRSLYVANTKGFGHDAGFTGDPAIEADSNAVWSTLEKIDLARVRLNDATLATLKNTRVATVHEAPAYPAPIRHVVVILQENKSFDSMLGDLGYGPADPSLVSFGAAITPNLHALAKRYALAGNIFADAEESDAGHQFFAGGIATAYSERTLFVKSGRRPLVNKNEDPEDYPRLGYIFNNLARGNISYRDYGDLVRVSGYDEGSARDPKSDDPNFAGADDRAAPTQGLGGRYSLDVPAPAVLAGHVDLNYPGWNLRIRDERRAREFVRDYDTLVKAGKQPRYTYIWLPANHGGAGRDIPPIPEEVADGDRALGAIVQYLTHLPSWKNTAIFVAPDDAQSTRDHVDEYRTYALVISPYAKGHYVGMRHLSTVSILKTTEEILGVPPLSLGDLLATDMSDFFTPKADPRAYTAIAVPTQTAGADAARIAALLELTDQSAPDADSARGARIIGYAREADRLAAQRYAMRPAVFAARREALYERAVEVVRPEPTNSPTGPGRTVPSGVIDMYF